MAGPGGGPPRKSHTKSRKGCKTCKKRHIRCDENFPQCRNCTKHHCRCDYLDLPAASEEAPRSPRMPDLCMTPDIQREIDTWRMTGNPPFPELQITSRAYWHEFSAIDLRLVHHIAGLAFDLHRRGYSGCTVWAQRMPAFLTIGLTSDFVMNAILALSASHLAWLSENTETHHLAYHHRGVAIKGLHEAIGSFSRGNSEAILAASMILSWQATDWRDWASLQQGVSTVLNAMHSWAHESELATHLNDQRAVWKARMSRSNPGPDDLNRLDSASYTLQRLRQHFSQNQELAARISQLLNFTVTLRNDYPLQVPEEAFERLQPLRSWLFWLPPMMFRAGQFELGAMAVLSHFFAVALTLEPLFPELGAAFIGIMSISPMEDMQHLLIARRIDHPHDTSIQAALSLMDFPSQALLDYKQRQEVMVQNAETIYRSAPHSPYGIQDLQLAYSTEAAGGPLGAYEGSPISSSATLNIPAVPRSPYFDPTATASDSKRHSSHSQYMGHQSPHVQSPALSGSAEVMFSPHDYTRASSYTSHPHLPFGPEGELSPPSSLADMDTPLSGGGIHEAYQQPFGHGGEPTFLIQPPPPPRYASQSGKGKGRE